MRIFNRRYLLHVPVLALNQVSSLSHTTVHVKKNNFGGKIKLNKYQEENIDESSAEKLRIGTVRSSRQ